MATLRRPATRAKHNEVSIILILLLRPKTEAKGGGGGVGASVWTVRVLEWCSARTLQIPERQARSVDDTLHSTTSRQCLGWGLIT